MEQIILGWAIDWWLGEHDYEGWGDIFSSIQIPKYTRFDKKFEARQGTSECVMFAIMWCIVDNTGYDFTLQDIDTLRSMLPKYWRTVKNGMYTSKWGDMFVDFFKTKWLTLMKNAVSTYSQKYFDLLSVWRSLTLGSDISKEYIEDIQTDWDIDLLFGGSTGHLRRLFYNKDNENYYEVENFIGSLKYNRPEMTDLKLREQLWHKTLHYTSFYFYFLENPPMIPEHNKGTTPAEKEIVLAWEKVINEWYVTKFKNFTDEFYITRMLIDIDKARESK